MSAARQVSLPRDTRYIENDTDGGIQMAQVVFGGTPIGIWVDCIECDRRDRIAPVRGTGYDATEAMSIDHAEAIFRDHGWTVSPTRCPDDAKFRRS